MKKGFTLIELLAVIVILAIIALIATPIALNIINQSKESAQLRSAEMYLDAVEQAVALEKMNNTSFNPNTCTITKEGNLLCDDKDLIDIKVKGSKPANGKITFEKGKIKNVTLEYGKDKVIIKNTKGELQYQNYISISNYQHKHTDGKVEDHEVTFDSNGHGTCSICMEEVLAAGLYDESNNRTKSWQELIDEGILNINEGVLTSKATSQLSNPSASLLNGKLIIDNSISSIGNYTFINCTGLTTIEIPESVISFGGFVFLGCTGLTTIKIPNRITNIDYSAFKGCTGLTTVTIPNSVTSIGQSVFGGCTGLTSIKIPNSVTSIGGSTFSGCTGLTTIEIPESVTSIGSSAFSGCTGLTTIEIPESVTNIGSSAFQHCTALTTITIPYGLTCIDYATFQGCTSLTTIEIPESVTNIGSSAFQGCTGLTTLEIPESVTNIGSSAFTNVYNVVYNGSATGSPWGAKNFNKYIENNILYSDSTKTKIEKVLDTTITTVEIPESVTSIGSSAFSNCTGLTSIEIPDSVTSIGSSAFSGCTGLTTVKISNSITSIDVYAFGGCTGLTTVTIPNSVTGIGPSAFSGCTGLTTVKISNNTTFIMNDAFSGCTSLTIYYSGTATGSPWGAKEVKPYSEAPAE